MRRIIILISLALVPFLLVLGNSMLIPVFPEIQRRLGISQLQVSLLITLFSFPAAIVIPVLGFLSDRIGRKLIIIPSVLLYGAGGLIAGLASTFLDKPYFIILVSRVLQGIGGAGTAYIAMALAGDIYKSGQRSKAMGILEASNGMGKVLSPILGSLFAMISWYFLFYVYAIISVPIALCIFFFVNEVKSKEKSNGLKDYIAGVIDVFRKKGLSIINCLIVGLVVFFTLFGMLSYMSDVFERRYMIKGLVKGLMISVPVFTMSLTSFFMGIILQKIKKFFKVSIVIGGVIVSSIVVFLLFIKGYIIMLIFLAVMGIGIGLMLTSLNTLITSCTSIQKRGAITSLYGSIRFLGVALGPPAFSIMEKASKYLLFLPPGIMVFVFSVSCLIFIKEDAMLEYKSD